MTIFVRPCGRFASAATSSSSDAGVQGRGRLVQDDDRRVPQDRPGDRDPLPLPAGQVRAALADVRVEPVRQPGGELVHQRQPRGPPHVPVPRPRVAADDVLPQRPVQQHGVLQHGGDLPAQRGQLVPAHVDAVDQHLAGAHVRQPRDERRDRALAGAGRPDQRDVLAGLDASG